MTKKKNKLTHEQKRWDYLWSKGKTQTKEPETELRAMAVRGRDRWMEKKFEDFGDLGFQEGARGEYNKLFF